MENANQWYFTKEQLSSSPSRKSGVDAARELSYRQQAANFIQDMGQRLQVSQLCINTAIVYMHRFYVFHSFTDVHRNNLSIAGLFLAAKIEEQPRKLEHVIKVAHVCLHKDAQALDVRSEAYAEKMNEVVAHENMLLQTLGFVLAIEHPHTYVVKVCQLVKASKDLAQTSYIMATTSLHMTTMCLLYKPTVVACVCIHLACKWSSYRIEPCSEGRDWFFYVDRTVTWDLLEKLTQDYISILERSPHRFKKKFTKEAASGYHGPSTFSIEESPQSRPSTSSSSERNSSSAQRDNSSPGGSYDFGADFNSDERRAIKIESPERSSVPVATPSPAPIASSAAASTSGISSQSSQKYPTPNHETVTIKIEPPDDDKVDAPVIKEEPRLFKPKPPKHRINSSMHETHASGDKMSSSVCGVSSQSSQKYSAHVPNMEPVTSIKVELESDKMDSSVIKANESHLAKPRHMKHKMNSSLPDSHSSDESVPARRFSPAKDVKTNGSKEGSVDKKMHTITDNNILSRKNPEVPSSKHERRERHKSKHSAHSSKDSKEKQIFSNHSDQSTGIKVKIRKDIISLSGITSQSSQKYPIQSRPESPKKAIKIKIPKLPMPETPKVAKPDNPTSIKLVITKDKSGTGSYSTSHKNERESRKRAHNSPITADGAYKNSHEGHPSKYARLEHSQRSHHVDVTGDAKHKRHSLHRSIPDHTSSNSTSARLQAVNDSTFHNYNAVSNYQNYPFQLPPPPPPPKMKGHGMLVGKTNSNPPLPPPLPPPPPPPPE